MRTPSSQHSSQHSTQRRRVSSLAFAATVSLLLSVSSPPSHAQAIDVAEQARVSREKLVAEIARVDADLLRDKLLQSADNERLAHWYAGEVLVDDQWLTLDEAQQQAANQHLKRKPFRVGLMLRITRPRRTRSPRFIVSLTSSNTSSKPIRSNSQPALCPREKQNELNCY